MYFNTTHEVGDTLKQSHRSAAKQENVILAFFRENPDKEFTPFEVARGCEIEAPITSVRRAINSLTKEKKLEKTFTQRKGEWGKLNYCWKLI